VVVVIGAGLVGLCIAYELAKRGAEVRVVEANASAAAGSWAGAGKLAPFTDSDGDEQEELFLATALGVYQVFVRELHKRTGVDPHLLIDGIIEVAHDEPTAVRLRERAEALVARGIHAHWLDAGEARDVEPSLGPALLGASLIEDEGHIDARELGRALRLACVDAGVQLEEQTGPVRLRADERQALGVEAAGTFIAAEAVVNAAGPWAGQLAGVPEHVQIPVRPAKGQLLALSMPRRMVKRLVTTDGAFVIPRADATLLIGETVEESGFDTAVDDEAIRRLREAVIRVMPVLAEFEVSGAWAGLHPRTPNGRPFVGATALDRYFVAAGHDRNGILLAPATALAIANTIEG
jgi:glycine oxidase